MLSHSTAAVVWGIFRRWEMPFEVTVASMRRRTRIRVHRAQLEPRDMKTHLGLRVTSAAQTLNDIAPRLPDKSLRRAVNDLRRAGYLHLHELDDVVERSRAARAPGGWRP